MMEIIVPSMQRSSDIRTIVALINAGLAPVVLVPAGEIKAYASELPVGAILRSHPARIKGIAKVRQFIMEQAMLAKLDTVVMVDDDLSFHTRRKDDVTKFTPSTPSEIKRLFAKFEKRLTKFAHVSMIGRQGGHRFVDGDVECSRPWHIFGFNVAKFNKAKVAFGAGLLQDDFDITLQLLRKGLPNLILTGWAVNQHHGHGAPGGAASYRTVDDHNASIEHLRSRHPDFVRTKERAYKGDPWLGTRMEAIIAWKKAYKESQT